MPSNHAKSVFSMPLITLVALAMVWLASVYVPVRALNAKAFVREKLAIFSRLISGQAHQVLGEYVPRWLEPLRQPAYFALLVLGVFVSFARLSWHTSPDG